MPKKENSGNNYFYETGDFATKKTGHAYHACPGLFSDYHSEQNEIRSGFPRFFICPFHP